MRVRLLDKAADAVDTFGYRTASRLDGRRVPR
jgi:hypothetical protein